MNDKPTIKLPPLPIPTPMAAQDEREAFEVKFPMPSNCMRVGNTYAATEFHAWDAQRYGEIRKGWLAAIEFLEGPWESPSTPPAQQARIADLESELAAPMAGQDALRAKAENFISRMRKGAEGDREAERELECEDADEAQACAVQAHIQEGAADMVEQLLAGIAELESEITRLNEKRR